METNEKPYPTFRVSDDAQDSYDPLGVVLGHGLVDCMVDVVLHNGLTIKAQVCDDLNRDGIVVSAPHRPSMSHSFRWDNIREIIYR